VISHPINIIIKILYIDYINNNREKVGRRKGKVMPITNTTRKIEVIQAEEHACVVHVQNGTPTYYLKIIYMLLSSLFSTKTNNYEDLRLTNSGYREDLISEAW
jgi:hypothetical protein